MKKILLALICLPSIALAAQQEITAVPDSPVLPSIGSLKDAINLRLADIDENFDEIYPILTAGPVYVNTTAPADTKVVWIDTDQDNAIKVNISGTWTVVGTAGAGDNLGSAAYTDVVALWTTCTGYLKSDGTCDTPSGSATYPSAAGVANWNGSAWGTSYTVGAAANNLVQLNASAQLPAVSAALLTNFPTLNQNTTGTAGGLSGTPNITVGTISAGASGFGVDADGDVTAKSVTVTRTTDPTAIDLYEGTGGGDNKLTLTLSGNLAADVTLNADQILDTGDVDDTPVNGVTDAPVSSNWAYDHEQAADPHAGYVLESTIGQAGGVQGYDADLDDLADGSLTGSKVSAASDSAVGTVELATTAETTTGTSTSLAVTPDGLSGSVYGQKEIGWIIKQSDANTAVADGKDAIVIPASMNGMNLTDVTCSVAALNAASSGATTAVIRRVRLGSRMGDDTSQFDLTFSTPNVTVTWDATGTDPGISTSTLAAGDEVDISGFATAANNGHFTVATVGANYFTFANASGVENLDDVGVTITPIRHRDMTSTGVTVSYNEYTASDETVDTDNDDVATGDKIYADVNAVTTPVQKGLSCTAVLQMP